MMAAPKVTQKSLDAVDCKIELSLGKLEKTVGFVLRIAQLSVFDRFFANFQAGEVKISEFTVLLAIAENPGVRQGVLADVLKIKWPNMTKLVRSLEERELICRHIPRHDRRSVELRLTEQGRHQVKIAGDTLYEADRLALSMLDDDEQAQLLVLLRKLAGWTPVEQGDLEGGK